MGKGQRVRTGRVDKQRRRQNRKARQTPLDLGPLGGGWHTWGLGETGDGLDALDDLDFTAPDDALLDTSGCPLAEICASCAGTTGGLRVVVSAFSKPGGFDVGCATLCGRCDGGSFVQLLDSDAFTQAFAQHAGHRTT